MAIDINKIRADFPILSTKVNNKQLVYFDNAATTQKPARMIRELSRYYSEYNSNIHRGIHTLANRATAAYENTRDLIARRYNADLKEVIFTKSDTESLNLLAYTLSQKLSINDEIIVSDLEHHSNIVPWQLAQEKFKTKFKINYAPFDKYGFLDEEELLKLINSNTRIISFSWSSNVFGTINKVQEIIKKIRNINKEIIIILDAAQYAAHFRFDFHKTDADFITFSAHKVFGPTGVGILLGKEEKLEYMQPFLGGGEMIKEVDRELTTYNDLPYKFEAGTPNIADVIAFKYSLEYLEEIGDKEIQDYERQLTDHLYNGLLRLEKVHVLGVDKLNPDFKNRVPLISFHIEGVHPHDIATMLDEEGIAVRAGQHCAQILHKSLNINSSIRASLAFYNTFEEIDYFIEMISKVIKLFS